MRSAVGKLVLVVVVLVSAGCGASPKKGGTGGGAGNRAGGAGAQPGPPVIDRFSERAGHIMVRGSGRPLPGPDQPIHFDDGYLTQGLGPDGAPVRYYHFDVQSPVPATVYRFVKAGQPIDGQLDVIDVIPGDVGYSDFWRVSTIEVPDDFVAGSMRSAADVTRANLTGTPDDSAHDCPIVPRGSTAKQGVGGAPTPTERWYRGHKVVCLAFGGEPLTLDDEGHVPTSPIYVSFNKNPGTPGGGPDSGFRTEPGSKQTHNVVFSVPGDLDYSPLWAVRIYDNAAFDRVKDDGTARAAPIVAEGPLVNCPIVFVAER